MRPAIRLATILLATQVFLVPPDPIAQNHAIAADPATPAFATNPDPAITWIGVKVLPKLDAVVTMNNEVIDGKYLIAIPWTVQDVDDNGFLVCHRKGWVPRSQVMTLDEALIHCTKVIDNGNNNLAWAYNHRAIAWQEKGFVDLAIADYGEYLRITPDARAYNNRGTLWKVKKEYDKAIFDFSEAIRIDKTFAMAYNNRGTTWRAKKDYDQAIADFDRAIQFDPDYANAYFKRGRAWHCKHDFDKALADYHESVRLDPNVALAYNAVAWLNATCPDEHYRSGAQAVDFATKACEVSRWKDVDSVDTLGAAYAESGRFDAAIKCQQMAIDLNPNDAEFVKGAEERLALYAKHTPYRDE